MRLHPHSIASSNLLAFHRLQEFICKRVGIVYVDIDGCLGPHTEHVRVLAYAGMLEKYTGEKQDLTEVAKLSGPPVDIRLGEFQKKFKDEYGIDIDFETLKKEHHDLYLGRIIKENQKPNPHIVKALEIAKKKSVPCVIVSNGTEEGIRKLLEHWGLREYFGEEIYAYDSARRVDRAGRLVADKTVFTKQLAESRGLSMRDMVAFEDTEGTLSKLENLGAQGVYIFNRHNRRAAKKKRITFTCAR